MTQEQPDIKSNWQDAEVLDLSGLKCPMPALLTERALRRLERGRLIVVIVTDALAPLDLRHTCERDGHEIVDQIEKSDGAWQLLICRGPRS